MDLSAFLAIGTLVLILGLALLIPGLWWARRKARSLPAIDGRRRTVTRFGYMYFAVSVTALMASFTSNKFVSLTHYEYIGCIVAATLFGVALERLAKLFGLEVLRQVPDERA